jgi:hypothetical protein
MKESESLLAKGLAEWMVAKRTAAALRNRQSLEEPVRLSAEEPGMAPCVAAAPSSIAHADEHKADPHSDCEDAPIEPSLSSSQVDDSLSQIVALPMEGSGLDGDPEASEYHAAHPESDDTDVDTRESDIRDSDYDVVIEPENERDSDYEVEAEESEVGAESDFEALTQESECSVDSHSESHADDEDSDYGHDAAKRPAARRKASAQSSCKISPSRASDGRSSLQKEKVSGLMRMSIFGSRSPVHSPASRNHAKANDGAQKERRRMVSQLLKPFGRKRSSYQKGVPRQKASKSHSFFKEDKRGFGKSTTASSGAKPFAAISQHLQQKKRARLAGGSDHTTSFSRKIRKGLLKRRCVPEEDEESDAYPSTQTILDSVPSPQLMQLARSIDARSAASD